MTDFLKGYDIQYWLESAPQGYLMDTEYGHGADEREPALILENETLREQAIRTTVQLVVGERCALAASSGLINAAPDEASKRFLATQTLDEARHVEVFSHRLLDLGVRRADLDDVVRDLANPHLVRFAEALLEKVDRKDFVAGVVGQNVILEGMAFHVFEMMHAGNVEVNPKFAHTLSGTIADERRHVGFGENRIGGLVREHPERKADIERLQREMSYHMLATFGEAFRQGPSPAEIDAIVKARGGTRSGKEWQGVRLGEASPEELEAVLSDTILKEFRLRLERIGVEYQTPTRPGPGGRVSESPHDLTPEAFREQVHSFEFWFGAVQGYLGGLEYGHHPGAPEAALAPPDRERLVTVLCNYCVGETAALEGAGGLIAVAPNRAAKIFLSTQAVDEGRHLEVLTHRLQELGVGDVEAEIARRANPGLLAFKRRLLQFVHGGDWYAAIFAQNVILEAMEFSVFHRHAASADPVTREVLLGIIKDERRHIGFGENELGRRIRLEPALRDRLRPVRQELDALVLESFAHALSELGAPRSEHADLGRQYREAVERLGFA